MRRSVKVPVVLLLLTSILISTAACASDTSADSVKIATQAVKQGDLLIGLYADGRVSMPTSQLNFDVTGKVTEILVTTGQTVAAGDPLARIDASELAAALTTAQLNVAKAEESLSEAIKSRNYTISTEEIRLISLERELYDSQKTAIEAYNQEILKINYLINSDLTVANAEVALEIAEETDDDLAIEKAQIALETAIATRDYNIALEQQKLIPIERTYLEVQAEIANNPAIYTKESQDYDIQKIKVDYLRSSDAAVTTAQFGVEDAKARLTEAQSAFDNSTLKAPFAGVIKAVNGDVGDLVAAATPTTTTGLITLSEPGKVLVTASITETDISDLKVDQAMRITVDALALVNQAGRITEISTVPKIDSTGIVTYLVTGSFDAPDERILDGMTTFVTYIKKEKQAVLLVSNKAIFIEENQQYAMVQLDDGTLEKRPVSCGLTNGTVSEVITGLVAGEKVVTSGLDK
ncbi:MAG: efflux RND transporter periplasmic adaptor subunit [Eubacteriales bacterium]|nr:efflux RND transporter periplasmic adaptor subunit [Eubacteriales bacterium]